MKIIRSTANNFILFENLSLSWTPGINIIYGDNNTGKTILLKALYATLYSYCKTQPGETLKELGRNFTR